MHADLIMMYNILNGVICVNLENYIFLFTMHYTRANIFNLYKYDAKLDKRNFFLRELLLYGIHYQMTLFVVLVLIVLLEGLNPLIYYTFLRDMHVNSTLHVLVCPYSMLKYI